MLGDSERGIKAFPTPLHTKREGEYQLKKRQLPLSGACDAAPPRAQCPRIPVSPPQYQSLMPQLPFMTPLLEQALVRES